MNIEIKEITLNPNNNNRLFNLCGPLDDNLKQLESQLKITIHRQDNIFKLIGSSLSIDIAEKVLLSLYIDTESTNGIINNINPQQVSWTIRYIQELINQSNYLNNQNNFIIPQIKITLKNKIIRPITINQAHYINNIIHHDITFGIGPAGTGKTYLAIAVAIDLLERHKIQHLVLSRPAIESGEKLGFLPGDFNQKIDPYIQPLYDALDDIIGCKHMEQLMQKNMIKIIPLAYMRGRTLNNSVIILDESQNTTIVQMKMFLTRIGFNSTVIITGDITQVDLPTHQESGLTNAIKILSVIKDISFNFFNKEDSVRHTIVTKILNAYEAWNNI